MPNVHSRARIAGEIGEKTPARPAMPMVSHRASQVQVGFCLYVLPQQYGMVGIAGIVWYVYKASPKGSALYSTAQCSTQSICPPPPPPSPPRLPCLPRFLSACMPCYHHIIVCHQVAIPHATSPPLLYLPRRASAIISPARFHIKAEGKREE